MPLRLSVSLFWSSLRLVSVNKVSWQLFFLSSGLTGTSSGGFWGLSLSPRLTGKHFAYWANSAAPVSFFIVSGPTKPWLGQPLQVPWACTASPSLSPLFHPSSLIGTYKMGKQELKTWHSAEDQVLLLQKTQLWFPASMYSSFQPPVIPASGIADALGLWQGTHLHILSQLQRQKHNLRGMRINI